MSLIEFLFFSKEKNFKPQALEMKMKLISEEAEIQNFEKSIKPLKKFDGDIPMDELLNLKYFNLQKN